MIEEAAVQHTGKKIGLSEEALEQTLDAWSGVEGRHYRGGTSPDRVRDHIKAAQASEREDTKLLKRIIRGIEVASKKRTLAFKGLQSAFR